MNMIIALASTIPAIFFAVFLLIYRKYDLEKRLPAIHAELEKRHAAAAAEGVPAEDQENPAE